MEEKERKDLRMYFHLKEIYNNGEILEEEYEELQSIIKRNKRAQEMELAEIKFYGKKISGEEYHRIIEKHKRALEQDKPKVKQKEIKN